MPLTHKLLGDKGVGAKCRPPQKKKNINKYSLKRVVMFIAIKHTKINKVA